jgi:hypothetical protein
VCSARRLASAAFTTFKLVVVVVVVVIIDCSSAFIGLSPVPGWTRVVRDETTEWRGDIVSADIIVTALNFIFVAIIVFVVATRIATVDNFASASSHDTAACSAHQRTEQHAAVAGSGGRRQ